MAATAVLRPLRPPHRILTILEGESLLNDATALLIYRLAVGAVALHGFSTAEIVPTFLVAVAGSVIAGPTLGWLALGAAIARVVIAESVWLAPAGGAAGLALAYIGLPFLLALRAADLPQVMTVRIDTAVLLVPS